MDKYFLSLSLVFDNETVPFASVEIFDDAMLDGIVLCPFITG